MDIWVNSNSLIMSTDTNHKHKLYTSRTTTQSSAQKIYNWSYDLDDCNGMSLVIVIVKDLQINVALRAGGTKKRRLN